MSTVILGAGGRTPHYGGGGQTPNYEGNRTPGHSSAWDPSITNTPARQTPLDQEGLFDDGPEPSPLGQMPPTPGSANPSTPGYAPETPMGERRGEGKLGKERGLKGRKEKRK